MSKFAYTPLSHEPEVEKANWFRRTDDEIYRQQHKLISKKHGKDVADKANYGWGSSSDDSSISTATKVYHPKGPSVLVSEATHPSEDIHHRWERY